VESFVDRQLFHGTAYQAAGWTLLGSTAGFGRQAEDFYVRHDRPKQLWVRALDPAGPAALQAAVENLLGKYPHEVVALYLHAFEHMNQPKWPNLENFLNTDPRLDLLRPATG
jgi:hypothetical protein